MYVLNLIIRYDKCLCAQKTKLTKAKFAVQFIRSAVKAMINNSVAKFILVKLKEHWRLDSRSIEDQAHLVVRCHTIFTRNAQVMDSVKILDRDPSWFQRGVKEAIYIRAHKPELNWDGGRFILPHIWDNSLTSLKPSGSSGVTVNPIQQWQQSTEEEHSTWSKALD